MRAFLALGLLCLTSCSGEPASDPSASREPADLEAEFPFSLSAPKKANRPTIVPRFRSVAEAAGIEMTYLAYQSLVGQPLPSTPLVRFPDARWISMKRDFAAAIAGWRQGELSLSAYLRSIRGVRRRAVFDLSDPLPFLYDVLRSPGQFLHRRSEGSHS